MLSKFKALSSSHAQRGYTIDQTILIVAVIAILVTMIIGSVGWDLLSRASGTKLSSHLKQIETANGQFFATHAVWPDEAAATPNPVNNFKVLVSQNALAAQYRPAFKDMLPAYDGNVSGAIQHSFGSGGDITMERQELDNQTYLVITMKGIPRQEYEEADSKMDGKVDQNAGRLRAVPASSTTVDISYYANVVN